MPDTTTEPRPDPHLDVLAHAANGLIRSEHPAVNSGIRLHLDGTVLCVTAFVWALERGGYVWRDGTVWTPTAAGREELDSFVGAGTGAS
jgi:hypothetical protein